MSAMEKMLADVLKKAIPPEVMEFLTPEKIQELGETINAFLLDIRNNHETMQAKLDILIQSEAKNKASFEAVLNKLEGIDKCLK